jgi:hypothetical protein
MGCLHEVVYSFAAERAMHFSVPESAHIQIHSRIFWETLVMSRLELSRGYKRHGKVHSVGSNGTEKNAV